MENKRICQQGRNDAINEFIKLCDEQKVMSVLGGYHVTIERIEKIAEKLKEQNNGMPKD